MRTSSCLTASDKRWNLSRVITWFWVLKLVPHAKVHDSQGDKSLLRHTSGVFDAVIA